MGIDDLAKRLSDRARIGLNDQLCERLGIRSEEATRGTLMAQEDDAHGHAGVYMLGAYVVDDTDFWGDGEIYWWCIPTFVDKNGKATWDAVTGLPSGAAPHKVGSLEWMTNFSLHDPPLLALIPPDEELAACVLRLAFYDDDGEAANMPAAMTAGLEALAGISKDALPGPDQIIGPVREAIFRSLKAQDDDILIDQNVMLRRGTVARFGAGFVGSEINSMVRLFYFVRDERKTEQIGPIVLHKGQVDTIRFKTPLAPGGRVALFSRGAEVTTTAFGNLSTDVPFVNRVLEASLVQSLANGFNVNGTGAAKLIAFYTPPA